MLSSATDQLTLARLDANVERVAARGLDLGLDGHRCSCTKSGSRSPVRRNVGVIRSSTETPPNSSAPAVTCLSDPPADVLHTSRTKSENRANIREVCKSFLIVFQLIKPLTGSLGVWSFRLEVVLKFSFNFNPLQVRAGRFYMPPITHSCPDLGAFPCFPPSTSHCGLGWSRFDPYEQLQVA